MFNIRNNSPDYQWSITTAIVGYLLVYNSMIHIMM
jgi:hypothetical protein